MREIVLSNRAREDLKRIWTYVAFDNESAADRLLRAIEKKIERLAIFPEIGTPQDIIRKGARSLVHGSYITLYEYHRETETVEIVAVVEGMRDLDALF